ncbi:flavin-binding monooxygenase-like domain-containing protein [Ditylenchus destructor]|nr:flavin-binding monooxygenase-like domain-containing protein [Ditylenchus destructor]
MAHYFPNVSIDLSNGSSHNGLLVTLNVPDPGENYVLETDDEINWNEEINSFDYMAYAHAEDPTCVILEDGENEQIRHSLTFESENDADEFIEAWQEGFGGDGEDSNEDEEVNNDGSAPDDDSDSSDNNDHDGGHQDGNQHGGDNSDSSADESNNSNAASGDESSDNENDSGEQLLHVVQCHDLYPNIRYLDIRSHTVLSIRHAHDFATSGNWRFEIRDDNHPENGTQVKIFDCVLLCPHVKPNYTGTDWPGRDTFQGNSEGFEDTVMVVVMGVGNSDVNVAAELSRVCREVYVSTRRGVMSAHPTVNDELSNRIISGTAIVKPNIKEFTKTGISWENDTPEIDNVVLATGHYFDFSLLENGELISYEKKNSAALFDQNTAVVNGLIQFLRRPKQSDMDTFVLVVLVIMLGFFAIPVFLISLELGVETTFPLAEATSSGILIIAGQLLLFLTTFMMQQLGSSSWIYGAEKSLSAENFQLGIDFWTLSAIFAAVFSCLFLWPRYHRLERLAERPDGSWRRACAARSTNSRSAILRLAPEVCVNAQSRRPWGTANICPQHLVANRCMR